MVAGAFRLGVVGTVIAKLASHHYQSLIRRAKVELKAWHPMDFLGAEHLLTKKLGMHAIPAAIRDPLRTFQLFQKMR